MQTVTSISASGIPREDLGRVLADYLALDRLRLVRRLLVTRCGLLALGAAVAGSVIRGFSPSARWSSVALFLVPPAWAWIAELCLALRLSRALDGLGAADSAPPSAASARPAPAGREKVVRSS